MNNQEYEDSISYNVVTNHEEQYSIWPTSRENALGWHDIGKRWKKLHMIKISMSKPTQTPWQSLL